MMNVSKSSGRIRLETATTVLDWDLSRGGQLTGCRVKGSGRGHELLSGRPAPALSLTVDGRKHSVVDGPVTVTFGREDDQCFSFTTRGRLADTFDVEQTYHAFREGALFCEFNVSLDEGKAVKVADACMGFPLDVRGATQLRGNYVSRDPYPKQDVTCVHILSDARVCIDREERIDLPQLLSVYGLDLGWNDARYYSNRVEMIMEDSTSVGDGMLGATRTVAGPTPDGEWDLTWHLCPSGSQSLAAPFFYRNRWAVFCGAGRTEAGPEAARAKCNNAMASRVCHVMYPYVREGQDWPWSSVPIRQTFYQDAQVAAGNPGLDRIDEAAKLGANVLVLHQFWMTNGGSNGEPMAEYKAYDPKWLKAFIKKAHAKGMRVLFYTRGIERYSLYSDYFERYLTRDFDGLYVDWATPFALGYCKSSSKHFSAFDWFMFARALRNRVGENGLLIAHSAVQTSIATSLFDAVLVGEFSVMHSGLLADPEKSASYAMVGGCGVSLIAGNSPDRAVFSSQKSAAFCAGLGYSAHPFMEPDKDFGECSAYMHPLWKLWQALGQPPVRMVNPAVGERRAFTWSDEALHPLAYVAEDGTTLITVANLSDRTVSGTVKLNARILGLPTSTIVTSVTEEGCFPLEADGTRIRVTDMPPWGYGGVLAKRG